MFLYGVSTLLLLTSCGTPVVEKSMIETFLTDARQGFEMNSTSREIVKNNSTGEKMFENVTNYHYIFDSNDGGRVDQTIKFKANGQDQEAHISFKRNKDGYAAKEYVNYKNTVDEYLVIDAEGNSSIYDHYFYNPFNFIFEEDLVKDENNENLYHLNPRKMSKFEYFVEGKGTPTKSIDFLFNNDGLENITIISETLTGKAHDPVNNMYVSGSWHNEDVLTLTKLGEAKVEQPLLSESNEYNDEIANIFSKVQDNYTLTLSLRLEDAPSSDETTQVVYFDGDSCYVDNNKATPGHEGNKVYKVDEFKNDGLLYEYEYNDAGVRALSKNIDASSYNITPKDKNYFIPHVKEIAPELFVKNNKGQYICENKDARPFIGTGFFSDFNASPFFSFGYGLGATLTYDTELNELEASLPFKYVMNGYLYTLIYEAKYSNLCNTTLPLKD